MTKIKYLAQRTLDGLKKDIPKNLSRYKLGDFEDMVAGGDWSIELDIDFDLGPLNDLSVDRSEAENSLLVWRALSNLTPALACEERIWSRLTHVECLDYSRNRWIQSKDDEGVVHNVATHFFAKDLGGRRDDNAIGRLWWNARIAKNIRPSGQREVLKKMLQTTDHRLNFIERSLIVNRPRLAEAIIRIIERNEDAFKDAKGNFRPFMRTINKLGGGIVFELKSDKWLDEFMDHCFAISSGASKSDDVSLQVRAVL